MPAPLHPEAKRLILRLMDYFSPQEVAYWLGLHPETVFRIRRQFKKTGDVENTEAAQTGRNSSVPWKVVMYILRLIKNAPDMYLCEIQERVWIKFDQIISLTTIHRITHKQGYYRKQQSKVAIERDEVKRARFFAYMSQFTAEQLVFLDESAIDVRMTFRKFGRGERGERIVKRANFVRGKRYSVLPALSLFGCFLVRVVQGSITGDIFEDFVMEVVQHMNPYPGPKSVLVMDNASIHRNEDLEDLARERGIKLVYLPAYSPDFNPIEEGFSALKAWIRRRGPAVRKVLQKKKGARRMLKEAVYEVMSWPKPIGWYSHSGYCSKADFEVTESESDVE